ncbi:MAG: ABC transporter substrate-binding protein [Alphaproteobacteria bacterium]|nr:ABC transporter substrate-binding protein [Alphaproteobacteria bacterium]
MTLRAVLCAALWGAVAAAPGEARAADPRVVTLGGAVTETAFALGAGTALVGVDDTSMFPAAARALPKVGYFRNVAAEGIASLRPDRVIAGAGSGPQAALGQLEQLGMRVVALPEAFDAAAALERVRLIGTALGRDAAAQALLAGMREDLDQVAAALAGAKSEPRVLFLLGAGRGAPMASGGRTAADAMIRLARARNAVEGFVGYKALNPESAVAAAPDVILTTRETLEALGSSEALLRLPELAQTRAARAGRLVALDGVYLLGFGPRLAHALRDLAAALHPELRMPTLRQRAWVEAAR